ncbi:MAG TPA: Holliday junction branch migration protein RuvA [Kofleriaceae bacterium]|nr:Holliday junction branch migration protein RuvA [Kofleriaceae bacterium]
MIARLDGVLLREGEQVIVDCNGVGYEVTCSAYTLAALPAAGEKVTLRVYTQMRETAIALYGFAEHTERSLFDLLITVKNVGPSTAIAILSGAGPRDIAGLIARQDVPGLTKIKGVGKKTAELLVVELHEKCELLLLSWNAQGGVRPVAQVAGARRTTAPGMRHPMLDEVAAALVGMGWRPAEADAACKELDLAAPDLTIEALIVQALRKMPR